MLILLVISMDTITDIRLGLMGIQFRHRVGGLLSIAARAAPANVRITPGKRMPQTRLNEYNVRDEEPFPPALKRTASTGKN